MYKKHSIKQDNNSEFITWLWSGMAWHHSSVRLYQTSARLANPASEPSQSMLLYGSCCLICIISFLNMKLFISNKILIYLYLVNFFQKVGLTVLLKHIEFKFQNTHCPEYWIAMDIILEIV